MSSNLVYFDVIDGSVRFTGLRQNLDHVKGRISLIHHILFFENDILIVIY